MNDEQQRIERTRRALAIVYAALERDEGDRAGWAERECGADPALRDEVRALLAADRATIGWASPITAEVLDDPLVGQTIERYRIVARLGAGGMGTVYRAEAQGGVQRPAVALKVIKRGMDSEEIVQRFLRERDILARLQHPNIARLLDGGMSADGRPWFVLELVDGEPLLDYCERQRASIEQRLALMLQVCDAVDYAHRNLIVHRDLKPSNVLVDRDGRIKLLDFGIAKLLTPEGEAATRSVAAIMTPEYAAPEQFARAAITTQTDVYQLGALLGELLSGRKPARPDDGRSESQLRLDAPFRAADAERDEGLRRIAEGRGLQVASLARRLSGDLDRITRRAMAALPEQRYVSVAAFAEDLRRHLRGEAVLAMDDSLRYRLGKFVRRHRLAVFATAAILLSLTIGLGLALRENARSHRAEAQTETTLALLEDVFLSADPYAARGDDTRASDLLDGARTRLAAAPDLAPALATRLWSKIASAYVSLEQQEHARAALAQVLAHGERALACRGLGCVGPDADAVRATMAAARARLGHFGAINDHRDDAVKDIEAAIAEMRQLGAAAEIGLAEALQLLNDVDFDRGQYANLDARSAEAVAILRRARGEHDQYAIMAVANRASLQRASGKLADAVATAKQAYHLLTAAGDSVPGAVALYVEQQYAGALSDKGQPAEAEPLLARALERAQALRGPESGIAGGLAWELAGTHYDLGRYDEAIAGYRRMLAATDDMKNANVAAIHNALGNALLGQGDAVAAAESYGRGAALLCETDHTSPPCVVVSLNRCDALVAIAHQDPCLKALQAPALAMGGAATRRWQLISARASLRRGDPDAAEAALAAARAADPGMANDPILRGHGLRLEAAIAVARDQPDTARALYAQAIIAYELRWTGDPPALREARAGAEAP
jgi:serine/threonine-protein kinase